MSELAFFGATRLAAKIRARRVGSVELLALYRDRIARFNPAVNAVVATDFAAAEARAEAADRALARGKSWGPLHGVPVTVKEAYDVAGMATTWGLPELADTIATTNAVVVDRLIDAGAIVFGKTNVPTSLVDWQSFNAVYGTTNNPWDLGRTPGGSSGGSAAALAAGFSALEAGSDIGASIRNPAHYCGVYGHKPTHGIVPARGHATPGWLSEPDIAVVGPMARDAEDLALALEVMAGPDRLDAAGWRLELPAPAKPTLGAFRVAVMVDDPNAAVDRDVADRLQAVAEALARAGATVDDRARPAIDTVRSHDIYIQLMRAVTTARQPPEQVAAAQALADARPADDRGYAVQVARATVQHHRHWIAANEERTHLRRRWAEFFDDFDLLLCPAAASAAFPHDQDRDRADRRIPVNGRLEDYNDQLFWAGYGGLVYLPATVAPAGRTPAGLPVGVQIIGPHLADRTTIDFARLLAQEIGGFQPPPGYD